MDIYTAIAHIFAESLAIGNGILSHLVYLPANATGPFDSSATLTESGMRFASDIAAAATTATGILSTTFQALF